MQDKTNFMKEIVQMLHAALQRRNINVKALCKKTLTVLTLPGPPPKKTHTQ